MIKSRKQEVFDDDSLEGSKIINRKLKESYEVDTTLEESNWVTDPIFYEDDFVEPWMQEFWETEFNNAHKLSGDKLKNWAEKMLDHLNDFDEDKYYIRDEIAEILNDIIRTGRLDGGRVDECEQKPIKEAEGMYAKINKWIADTEAEIAEKKKQLKATDDDDEKDILMNDISNLEIHLGDLEAQLDELDYIDNGDPALRSYYEAMEQRLDEEEDDIAVEWELIWHPSDWDMQHHDANMEDFDSYEAFKARLKEVQEMDDVTIVSANSYNKEGDIVDLDLDMVSEEDEFDFDYEDYDFDDEDNILSVKYDDVDIGESLNETKSSLKSISKEKAKKLFNKGKPIHIANPGSKIANEFVKGDEADSFDSLISKYFTNEDGTVQKLTFLVAETNESLNESLKSNWHSLLATLDKLGIEYEEADAEWNDEIKELIKIDDMDAFALCDDGICFGECLDYWDEKFNALKLIKTLYTEYKDDPENYPSLKAVFEKNESLKEDKCPHCGKDITDYHASKDAFERTLLVNGKKYILAEEYGGFGIYQEVVPSGSVVYQSYAFTDGKIIVVSPSYNNNDIINIEGLINNYNKTGKLGVRVINKDGVKIIESLEEDEVEVEVKEKEVVDDDNPLNELPDTIEPIFEFPSGNYVYVGWNPQSKSLIAGGATNTGIIPEFEHKYDFDISLDENLQELYDKIITEHPEYLDPIDGGEGEEVEIQDEVEVKEESLKASDIMSTEEFLDWHDGEGGKDAPWEVLERIYNIFKENGCDEDEDVDICYEKCSDKDKMRITTIIKSYSESCNTCTKKKSLEESSSDVRDDGSEDEIHLEPAEAEIDTQIDTTIGIEDNTIISEPAPAAGNSVSDNLDNLSKDEQEAIDGYQKTIDSLEHLAGELEHLKDEEIAHKEFLDAVKHDIGLDYEHPEENIEVIDDASMTSVDEIPSEEIINVDDEVEIEEESLKEDANIKDIRSDTQEGDIRPTEEQKQLGRDDDWDDFEVNHGYGVFSCGWNYAPLECIARIDIMDVFPGDAEAVEQAEKDGFKFLGIKDEDLDDMYDFLPESILDTEQNRANISNYLLSDAGDDGDLLPDDGEISLATSDLEAGQWYENVDNNKTGVILTEEEKNMPDEIKVEDEIEIEDDLPDTDDEEGSDMEEYWDALHEHENEYSDEAYTVLEMVLNEMGNSFNADVGDLINEGIDNACIYYKDCWNYLWNTNITDFEEAIAEGATGLCSIAYHYLAEEVYELAAKIGLEW